MARPVSGALIVTAELGPEDFAWLNSLRARHYPPERNQLAAHLTMFHAIPPSTEQELRTRLKEAARAAAPAAAITGLLNLGQGVAFRVASEALDAMRAEIAWALHGLLTAQDAHGWRPHVTIQNKVPPRLARELLESLEKGFEPRPLKISGFGLYRYLSGPWEPLGRYSFRNR